MSLLASSPIETETHPGRPTPRGKLGQGRWMSRWCVAGVLATLHCAHARPTEISSAELRAEIDRHSCAYSTAEYPEYSALFLDAERCPVTSLASPLGRAVAEAIAEAHAINFLETTSKQFDEVLKARPRPTQAAADTLARSMFWRDPLLVRAVLDRALARLPAHRLRCADCQAPPRPAPRIVAWSDFFPYITAFIWPVEFEAGKIDVYMCSANNGAAALPPDEAMIHAAKLAAVDFGLEEPTRQKIRNIAHGEASRSLADVATLLAALIDAPASRARICTAVVERRWFTGVTIDPC